MTKAVTPSIRNYTLYDVGIDAGRKEPVKDFLIFKTDEMRPNEEMIGRPLRSNHFSIALILQGEGNFQINLVDHHIKKNSLVVVPFNVIHQFQKADNELILVVVSFSHSFLGQARFSEKHIPAFDFFSSKNNPYLPLLEEDASNLYMLIKMLRRASEPDTHHPFKTEIVHHGFNIFMFEVAGFFKKNRPATERISTRKEDILTSFIKLLLNHFREERGVQFYADALYLTPKHLTKMVKELTNKTCSEMIDEIVIIEAKIMLNDLGLSVASVAEQLQFSDQFFFSKFFKKHTGITPSKYKNINE